MNRCERCGRRTHGTAWCPGGTCEPRLITATMRYDLVTSLFGGTFIAAMLITGWLLGEGIVA